MFFYALCCIDCLISRKFNFNTILYFDFHQGCVIVIHVILQVRGSSSTLLLFVMSCYVFVNTSSKICSFDKVVNFAIHQAQC
jgi:hypothetical protein